MDIYNDEIDFAKIGQKVKTKRQELGMSQEQLAEACDISYSYIGHIERASRNLSLNTAIRLSQVLNISLDYLLLDAIPTESAIFNSIQTDLKNHNPQQVQRFLNAIKILSENIDKL